MGAPQPQWRESLARPGSFRDVFSFDPAAIKLIRKAMAYDRGTKAVADKVVENGKIKAKIKVPVKPGSPTQGSSRDRTRNDAMARLRKTGSENDAEAAFLARFGG